MKCLGSALKLVATYGFTHSFPEIAARDDDNQTGWQLKGKWESPKKFNSWGFFVNTLLLYQEKKRLFAFPVDSVRRSVTWPDT